VNGARIRALRHAREIVYDMRWRGMTVPAVYSSMAEEFQAFVRSDAYAAWVATSGRPSAVGRPRPPYGGSWGQQAMNRRIHQEDGWHPTD
jgi:hypothetical protein